MTRIHVRNKTLILWSSLIITQSVQQHRITILKACRNYDVFVGFQSKLVKLSFNKNLKSQSQTVRSTRFSSTTPRLESAKNLEFFSLIILCSNCFHRFYVCNHIPNPKSPPRLWIIYYFTVLGDILRIREQLDLWNRFILYRHVAGLFDPRTEMTQEYFLWTGVI